MNAGDFFDTKQLFMTIVIKTFGGILFLPFHLTNKSSNKSGAVNNQ